MLKRLTSMLLACGLLFALAGTAAPAQARPLAAVFTVTNCTDAGLRSALSKYDTIYFNCSANPATITLTSQLTITRNTIIDGGGKVILDGQGTHRIIRVNNYTDLLLKNITLQNGHAVLGDDNIRPAQGGAVLLGGWSDATFDHVRFLNNKADATGSMAIKTSDICEGGGAVFLSGFNYAEVFNSTFSGNVARNGAAINNLAADLVISNSTFENNAATLYSDRADDGCGGGGALYVDGMRPASQGGQQKITISRSVFRGNTTNRKGGAFYLYLYSSGSGRTAGDTMIIDYSTFEGNRSETATPGTDGMGGGGAIAYVGAAASSDAKLIMRNSTVNSNHADFLGGGIWAVTSPMELYNVTIANNEAKNTKTSTPSNRGAGGGIMINHGGTYDGTGTRLIHVTVAGNSANYQAGGIGHWGSTVPSQARLGNSIVANNSAPSANNCTFTFVNLGGNVQYPSKNTGDADCSASVTFGNPSLGTLADNGGQTKTISIGNGTAVNHGSATYCTGFTLLDQRGYARNGACDSGAFEYDGVPLSPSAYLPLIIRK